MASPPISNLNLQLPPIITRWLTDMLWSLRCRGGVYPLLAKYSRRVHPLDTVSTIIGDALLALGGSTPRQFHWQENLS
ncbi:MAG: hypothetical protein U0401_16385 [Anaerolineae bacterium]